MSDLKARADAAKADAESLILRADRGFRDELQVVIHHLDDVNTFFLASQPINEEWWLDSAERHLEGTLQRFASVKQRIDSYGGPERAKAIS